MSRIVISDLPDSIELDREAMRAISGGQAADRLALQPYRSTHFQNPLDFTGAVSISDDLFTELRSSS